MAKFRICAKLTYTIYMAKFRISPPVFAFPKFETPNPPAPTFPYLHPKFEIVFHFHSPSSPTSDPRAPATAYPPPSVLTLLVKKGPGEGRTLQHRAGDGAGALRVGRVARGNDLSVRDAGASQRHLSVDFLPPPAARWAVTDLGSSNGTLLNGAPLVPTVPAPLSDGDLVKIGESTVIAVSISIDAGPGLAVTRRSARNTAAVAAAVEQGPAVSRRAGRRKAVELAGVETDEEDEAAAIPRRGRSRKVAAAVVLPPQPRNMRSARAAARRGEAVGSEIDEEKVARTGRGRGRVTRASARNGTSGTPEDEEEEEGEVAVARDRGGTAAEGRGDEEEDMVETTDRTSIASEVVPAAARGRAKRGRRGRGRATRESTRKAENAVVENDENGHEERDMADGRERGGSPLKVLAVNDGSGEDKVAIEDDKLDGISKASIEDEKMVDVEEDATLTERAIEGRVDARHAPANNVGVGEEVKNFSKGGEIEVNQELREKVSPESNLDGGAGVEKGHSGKRTGKRRLEDMTLGEWFVQIEKFLLAKNKEAAEKAIAEVQEKHRWFCEHVKMLKKSHAP